MGIYIFTWAKLKAYLIADEADKSSHNDFGKNIIPNMLKAGEKMYTYDFKGYWKDVGTISSLWEANMDVLDPNSGINLDDPDWKIYARNMAEPPHYVGEHALIKNSVITEGCEVDGEIVNSIIFRGAHVERGTVIHDSIVMPDSVIKAGAVVEHAIIGWEAVVSEGAKVGKKQNAAEGGEWKIAVVAPESVIRAGSVVAAGEMTGEEGK